MARARLLIVLLAVLVVSGLVGVATAAAGGPSTSGEAYRKYALVRQQLYSCSLDRTWHHLSASQRRRCRRLRPLYILWSAPGESGFFHVYCKTRRCPPWPEGEPNPRAPLPSDAKIHRF